MFGRRYEIILELRENWDQPEVHVAGYIEFFYEKGTGFWSRVSNRNTEALSTKGPGVRYKADLWEFFVPQVGITFTRRLDRAKIFRARSST